MNAFSFKYMQKHLPHTSPKRSRNRPMDWQYITIHNPSNELTTAKDEYYLVSNPSNTSIYGSHIIMDEDLAIEIIPLNETSFSCGTENSNGTSISIELCIRPDYEKLLSNAAELIAYLLNSKGFDTTRLVQHHHWNSKNCPKDLRSNNQYKWNILVTKVQECLDAYNRQENIIEYEMMLNTRQNNSGTVQICLAGLVNMFDGTIDVNEDKKSATIQVGKYKFVFYAGDNRVVDQHFIVRPLNGVVSLVNHNCFYVPLVKVLEYLGGKNIRRVSNNEIQADFSTFSIQVSIGTNIVRKIIK